MSDFYHILLVLGCILIDFLNFIIIANIFPSVGLYILQFFSFAIASIFLLCSSFFFYEGFQDLFTDYLNILCFAYIFFHFNNMGETARRIRILRELHNVKQMSIQALLKNYDSTEQVKLRLQRLLKSNQLKENNGKLFIGSNTLVYISLMIELLKKITIGSSCGIDLGDRAVSKHDTTS